MTFIEPPTGCVTAFGADEAWLLMDVTIAAVGTTPTRTEPTTAHFFELREANLREMPMVLVAAFVPRCRWTRRHRGSRRGSRDRTEPGDQPSGRSRRSLSSLNATAGGIEGERPVQRTWVPTVVLVRRSGRPTDVRLGGKPRQPSVPARTEGCRCDAGNGRRTLGELAGGHRVVTVNAAEAVLKLLAADTETVPAKLPTTFGAL